MSKVNLPNQWIEVILDEVVDKIVGGGTPSKAIPSYFQGNIPWMTVKDMNKFVLNDTVDHISEAAVRDSATNIIPAGTPIIATRMSLGKLVRATFDAAINQDLKAIFINKKVSKIYFEYWYRSIAQKIQEMGTGTTVKGIRLEDIKQLNFVLAPFAEQQQIAQKLDGLLAQVDALKTRLDAIPKILKRFRQSVLAAAVSGRLTEGNSEALKIPLGDVFEIFSGFAFKKSDYSESGSRLLQIANVGYAKVIWDDQNFIPQELADSEYESFRLREGDIVLAMNRPITNETLKVAKIHSKDLPATLYQRVSCLRIKSGFSASYAYLAMQSPIFLKLVELNLQGSDQPYLNSSTLPKLEICAPNYEDQVAVVRRIEQLFAYADQIERRVKDAQARANNLTQSILAKVFRGELTAEWRAQNPELISGENSAVALLERVKVDRDNLSKTPKAKKNSEKMVGGKMTKQIIKVIEALALADKPLSGQQLLVAAGYSSDSSSDLLEQFFLDIREAIAENKTIVKVKRTTDGQDWFALTTSKNK